MFRKFHGITLANGSVIENLHIERLAADPSPVAAGRLWFNTTDKKIKFSTLDSEGAVIINSFASAEELAAALASADTALRGYVDGEVAAIQSQVDALGNAFNYVGVLPAQSGITGTGTEADPYVLDGMSPGFKDAGDYYKVTESAHFKFGTDDAIFVDSNDGLVFNTAGGLDRINNQQSSTSGVADEIVVTGSVETGFVVGIAQAVKDDIAQNATDIAAEASRAQSAESTLQGNIDQEVTDRQAAVSGVQSNIDAEVTRAQTAEQANADAITAEVTRAQAAEAANAQLVADEETRATAAEAALQAAIDAEVSRAQGAEGDLSTLTTDAKGTLVAAINEVAEAAGEGTDALKDAINAKKKIYTAGSAQLSHSFNHGFTGADLVVTVLVKDETENKWYNDSVLVEVDPATTTVNVPLQEAAIIKIIVEDLSDLG